MVGSAAKNQCGTKRGWRMHKTRSTFRWERIGVYGGLMLILAGCGTASAVHHAATNKHAAVTAKPEAIYATPKDTLGITAPLPNGQLWMVAGNVSSKGIFALDLPSKKIGTSASVSNAADAIAEASTGVIGLGMATPATGGVEFLNSSSGKSIASVAVSGPVQSIAAGDNGTTFYALNGTTTAQAVAVINSRTAKVTRSVPAPKGGVAVVASPNQQSLYILESNGNVDEVAIPSGQLESLFTVGHSGYAETLSPGGHTLYVLKGQGSTRNVAVVDINTEKVTEVLPAPSDANSLSLSPNGTTLYVGAGSSTFGNVQAYRFH